MKPQSSVLFGMLVVSGLVVAGQISADEPGLLTAEKSRAEWVRAVSAAKARVFSDKVGLLQASVNRSASNLHFHKLLLEDKQEAYRLRQHRPGLIGQAQSAGDLAGLAYLEEKVGEYQAQLEKLSAEYEVALQQETWRLLSKDERTLLSNHDLVPPAVAKSPLQDAPVSTDNKNANRRGSDWKWTQMPLQGIRCEVSFPSTPTTDSRDGGRSHRATIDGLTFSCSFLPVHADDLKESLQAQLLVKAQMEAVLNSCRNKGISAAGRESLLGPFPAWDFYVFEKREEVQKVDFQRVGLLGKEWIVLAVENASPNDELTAQRFFESFRATK